MKPPSLSRRAAVSALAAVLNAYQSVLASAVYDVDNGDRVPQSELDLVARAETALATLRKPRKVKPIRVIIEVSGGVVQAVYSSNTTVNVSILDHDNVKAADPEEDKDTIDEAAKLEIEIAGLTEIA